MATASLLKIRSPEELKLVNVTTMKKWYEELVEGYQRIIDGKVKQCPCCGEWLDAERGYYYDRRYVGDAFYICKRCVQDMVEQKQNPKDPPNETKESVQKVLFMLNKPYYDDLYENCVKGAEEGLKEKNRKSPFATYMTCIQSLRQYRNKTWKDSLFPPEYSKVVSKEPSKKTIKIFGSGFNNDDYEYLQDQYDDWCSRTQVDTKSQEMYVVQICLQSLEIYKDRKAGKDVTAKLKALDTLMSSANLQPRQNVNNAATDALTFGQLIEKWEEEEPIPEPSEEFKDVDGIGKYLRVWFAGHLAKALNLNNAYSEEYEEYIKDYTVNKPDYSEDETANDIYSSLFGKGDQR